MPEPPSSATAPPSARQPHEISAAFAPYDAAEARPGSGVKSDAEFDAFVRQWGTRSTAPPAARPVV